MRKFLLAAIVCLSIAGPAGSAAAAVPVATTEAKLLAIAITAREAGQPLAETARGLAGATNDTCPTVGASDRLRLARVQNYYHRKDAQNRRTSTGVSTEVVLYKPGGTSMLINELRSVATRCRVSKHDGSTTTWQTCLAPPSRSGAGRTPMGRWKTC